MNLKVALVFCAWINALDIVHNICEFISFLPGSDQALTT